ncbi:Unknown protein, partial [Striga hermonthica]
RHAVAPAAPYAQRCGTCVFRTVALHPRRDTTSAPQSCVFRAVTLPPCRGICVFRARDDFSRRGSCVIYIYIYILRSRLQYETSLDQGQTPRARENTKNLTLPLLFRSSSPSFSFFCCGPPPAPLHFNELGDDSLDYNVKLDLILNWMMARVNREGEIELGCARLSAQMDSLTARLDSIEAKVDDPHFILDTQARTMKQMCEAEEEDDELQRDIVDISEEEIHGLDSQVHPPTSELEHPSSRPLHCVTKLGGFSSTCSTDELINLEVDDKARVGKALRLELGIARARTHFIRNIATRIHCRAPAAAVPRHRQSAQDHPPRRGTARPHAAPEDSLTLRHNPCPRYHPASRRGTCCTLRPAPRSRYSPRRGRWPLRAVTLLPCQGTCVFRARDDFSCRGSCVIYILRSRSQYGTSLHQEVANPDDEEAEVEEKLHQEEEIEALHEEPEISMHAMAGIRGPRTMRLPAWVKDRCVVVLVDNGSSHNFINTDLSEKLKLPTTKIEPFEVRVANRERLQCTESFRKVPIKYNGVTVKVDLYALPLVGPEVVLGMQWLKGLGRVTTDYRTGIMEFNSGGRQVTL